MPVKRFLVEDPYLDIDDSELVFWEEYSRVVKDSERYHWLLKQAWFQSAFDRYDFDDMGLQERFELCVAEIIDAYLKGENE